MTDRAHDDRWDELALGHVLGGLPGADASEFRGHLASCSQCRARVAELRSLASDMAAAEREERTTMRLRTQTEARREQVAPERVERDPSDVQRRRALVAIALTALLVAGLAVWNAHLRGQNRSLRELAELQEQTIGSLGSGVVVPVTTSGAVSGVVSLDGPRVAWSLAGMPQPAAGERLVVWLETGDGTDEPQYQEVRRYLPSQLEDQRLASTVTAPEATGLLMTVESMVVPDQPVGRTVLEADLRQAE